MCMSNSARYRQNTLEQRSKRKSGCGCIGPILLIMVIIVALIIVFFRSQMRSYSNLNAGITVAQVCVYSTRTSLPTMYVRVILYDKDSHISFEKVYPQVSGEQVQLQGDIIKYSSSLNAVGLQSGYKLTRIQGYYNDPKIERNYGPDPIILNGGDDIFYNTVHEFGTPVLAAINDKPLSLKGDGYTYDIFVSPDGLFATKANGSLACGLKH